MYVLEPGDCFITPLFYDISEGFEEPTYDDLTYTELIAIDPNIHNQFVSTGGTQPYIVKVVDEQLINYNVRLEPTLGTPSPYSFV